MKTIDYYFAPISGYAYLGEMRMREVAATTGVRINYRPVEIGAVFAASNTTPPFKQVEARLKYREIDMARWAKRYGLPVNLKPKHWPAPDSLAISVIIATDVSERDAGAAAFALLKGVWAQDRNVADESHVQAMLDEAGLPSADIMKLAASPEIANLRSAYTQEAIARGVFGSPTYIVGDQLFWGQDRLDFVAEALSQTH
ncbi:MAG: 2-hydroxychromene-2-carboxylate isomerase [Chitinophagales bacterium]|nr:2-hydroxychromene-2-carboxylate isomerase [Hyphomicrobiales bacterium]